jgi:hypothetical protein
MLLARNQQAYHPQYSLLEGGGTSGLSQCVDRAGHNALRASQLATHQYVLCNMDDKADEVGDTTRRQSVLDASRARSAGLTPPLFPMFALQYRNQKKHNSLLLIAAARGYLEDVRCVI